jgi:hypothetical protein
VATTGPNVRPGEKPPLLPAEGLENFPAGADVFARYWIEALDWGYATTDSTLAKSLYVSSCTNCSRFVSGEFDSVASKGEHYQGGRLSISASEAQKNDHHLGATSVTDVTVSQAKLAVVSSSGDIVEKTAATPSIRYRVWLRWSGDWHVVDWKQVVSS